MQLGLIGYPLGHSKSPEIFAQLFKQYNIQGSYELYLLQDIGSLHNWLETVPHLVGFNITIPHKKTILPFLDEVSKEAEAIGAVNTVKITRANNRIHLKGYNTDYFGFKESLSSFLSDNTPDKALILGTGGSSNAVAYALSQMGIAYTKVSRIKSDASFITYSDVTSDIISQYPLIINTSPLGMSPKVDVCPQIPYTALTTQHYLYDLVYNPNPTLFLKQGKEYGANTFAGEHMLKLQAEKAWEIWRS
jgi:shikimate dehydrogenase